MGWEAGNRYRGRGVAGQITIKKNPKTGTRFGEANIEVPSGPMQGQRIKWRGYLNSDKNAGTTIGEMRVMGCRSQRLGDFSGFGTRDFEFTCAIDVGENGKKYPRAIFVRDVPVLSDKDKVGQSDVDDLNARFGDLLKNPPPVPSTNVGPAEEDDFPTNYADDEEPEQQSLSRS